MLMLIPQTASREAWLLAAVFDGNSDSSAAWVVWGEESGDLRGVGVCDYGRKELIHGNVIGTSCGAGQPYGKL